MHTFPKGIIPKLNVIALLGFELAYFETPVHHFYQYLMETPAPNGLVWFGWVGFYSISTIVCYLMPDSVFYIYNKYDL